MKTKGFQKKPIAIKLHPIYHQGIDRFVEFILSGIAIPQTRNRLTLFITNDIPDDPNERTLGLTSEQIAELRSWVQENRSRLPEHLEIHVLRLEDNPSHGMLWRLKDWTKIMSKL
jgi:hypothetical protein